MKRAILFTVIFIAALGLSGCSYNDLTAKQQNVKGKWANVESALQRRADLIPNLVKAAQIGRAAARNPEARAKHAESERRHAAARASWDASTQPAWLTGKLFSQKIQPLLATVSTSAIRSRIGVSRWYAGRIRQGYRPHPRHWLILADLVGVTEHNA